MALRAARALERSPGERSPGERSPGERSPGERSPGQRGPGQRGPGQRGPGERGLGLLEVLVAIGLVAATLAVGFQILGGATRGTIDADRYSRAVLLAESRLAELGVSEPLRQGETYGDAGDGYQWLVAVRPMPGYRPATASGPQQSTSAAGQVVPLVVSVTIAWGPDERPSEVTLTTLRLAARPR